MVAKPRRAWGALASLLALGLAIPLRSAAVAEALPTTITVKIVLAAVAYDRNADARLGDAVEIAVGGTSGNEKALLDVLKGYESKTLRGKAVTTFALRGASPPSERPADILFFSGPLGNATAQWVGACGRQNMICVSADRAGVEAGLPLGVEVGADGKPRLLVSAGAVKAIGMDLPASVLKLAEVIQGQ